ncbi:MAG: hypothetical protein J6X55_04110 [Victivallales bacterium]|nr:hypothetical protein [Victivallales bacterium]
MKVLNTGVIDNSNGGQITMTEVHATANNMQEVQTPGNDTSVPAESPIYFEKSKRSKADLLRILYPMYKLGFFTDQLGNPLPEKEAFQALTDFFHINIKVPTKNLGETRKVDNDSEANHRIFKELQEKLEEYLNNA